MLGTVQMGMMAALVVVLVPMGMAGWHLSRNKMLFFSGALFISLAVGVHLSSPFFPSSLSSLFVSSLSSAAVVVFDSRRHSCLSLLHDVVWNLTLTPNSSSLSVPHYRKSWSWPNSSSSAPCNFQTLSRSDASDLLNGSWIVVAGDSQARLFALSLLRLLLADDSQSFDSARTDLFKRHSDYKTLIPEIGVRLDFVWAPYADNLTDLVAAFRRRSPPDVLVMDAGLWHMLRVTNDSDYGRSLKRLRDSVVSLIPFSPDLAGDGGGRRSSLSSSSPPPPPAPHLFWMGMPTLINSMLNTEEKREKMTDELRGAYDKQLWKSKLLRQSGGPLLMLDIESLSWNCGVHCTEDGMHYDLPVYEATVQIMLNALLIDSHQKL